MRISTSLACLLAAFALAACGGGGGGGGTAIPPTPAAITTQPTAQSVTAGQSVTFTVAASGSGLTYQWQRNGADVAGATAASYTFTPQLADNGSSWTVIVKSGSSTLTSTPAILSVKAAPGITLLAGALGGQGNLDGSPGRLSNTRAIAVGPDGVVYVSDSSVLRTLTVAANGSGSLATLPGYIKGDALSMAIDASGNRYNLFGRSVRKESPAGAETFIAGIADQMGNVDAVGTAARFGELVGLTIDKAGNVYVLDSYYRTVRKIAPSGQTSTLASNIDGGRAMASDDAGNVYVATQNRVRKITPAGVVSELAGADADGAVDASGSAARFRAITSMVADAAGNVYAADGGACTIRKITPAGAVSTVAGKDSQCQTLDGKGEQARFATIAGLALDKMGNLYVSGGVVLRKVAPDGSVTTVAGKERTYSVDGNALIFPPLSNVTKMAVDAQGIVYTQDGVEAIHKVTQDGKVSRIELPAKTASGAAIQYFMAGLPYGGSIIAFADGEVGKVDQQGRFTWIAGAKGEFGNVDGSASVARFRALYGAQYDAAGNLYLNDVAPADWNMMMSVVRKITPAGVVSTLPMVTLETDNHADSSKFMLGTLDARGNAYFLQMNQAQGGFDVMKRAPDGTRTVLLPYVFSEQRGEVGLLVVDKDGNVYITESQRRFTNSTVIRKITPNGSSSIIAGKDGVQGAVPGPLPGSLGDVSAMAVDKDGVLYVATEQAILRITQ